MKKTRTATAVVKRRQPQQARAQHKVALIFEAAMQLLDAGDIDSLTTNAVAEKAGVSIGTLYQYFDGKDALIDALVTRELGALSGEVIGLVQKTPSIPGQRIRDVMRVVVRTYGGRERVHRMLIERGLTRCPGKHLAPLLQTLSGQLATDGLALPSGTVRKLTQAQSFVLIHAMAGVLRGLAAADRAPRLQDIEDALVTLIWNYVAALPTQRESSRRKAP